ncbi:hypothetical protein LTR91_014523 [Friedmanniomyces endolithicus]|uniref:TATA element modulatory factor 1 TATA binding domain-containing protein n=1 Tax=Friedmanniomyces endolithicus TaxID=329885 RepID=A0A4U0UA70_9PEZI|nr:hypothetical protein LTS09_016053 [Friedmanniomyces endolithicus]KAK0313142.1 hypothetical protein LTR82_013573 [Friedmanniomyces endolithicus]KAK0911011.1 hypothetical protein LTR57_015546 [Friedmanniomyces endolithicus]KAK0970098.1 hypothetical protein LTS01_015916 [Friedmanniomyces endolithicus]KAK0973977.1 hypothetical protein LTR91_014523 [Friedmanniomyces endolithicus]
MSSPVKQPQKKVGAGGGWGSLLSGAVANLESRLDTILAEDNESSARQRAGLSDGQARPQTGPGNLAPPSRSAPPGPRDASRTRVSHRLDERLAKATAAKNTGGGTVSSAPSRTASPANDASSGRVTVESKGSVDDARLVPEVEGMERASSKTVTEERDEVASANGVDGELNYELSGADLRTAERPLPKPEISIKSAKVSEDTHRPSVELLVDDPSSARQSVELTNGHSRQSRDAVGLEAEVAQMREDHAIAEKLRQEEMHTYLEKIDALQAKLKYLANETVAAARAANAESNANRDGTGLAEKDERIALLMEEGEKLSKAELRHIQTIKKLRVSSGEKEKAFSKLSKRLQKAENVEVELKQKLRRAEFAERDASQKAEQIAGIEKQVEELRVDRENASELVRNLTWQLKEAKERADRIEKSARQATSVADQEKIAALENEVEDAQIEKKLAEDHAAAETKRAREEGERLRERFALRESELDDEIAALQSRVEALRSRAEEVSSESGKSENGVMLLRQVETLQSQYSLTKANWATIEGTLNTRISVLEGERDEAVKREADVRKRVRNTQIGKRKAEEDVERQVEELQTLTKELLGLRETVQELQRRLDRAESESRETKVEFERQRRLWEAEIPQRIEEEKAKMLRTHHISGSSRTDSPATSGRKTSAVDLTGLHITPQRRLTNNRLTSNDLTSSVHTHNTDRQNRSMSRQSQETSSLSTPASDPARFSPTTPHQPSHTSPALGRQESALCLLASPTGTMPPTPSIEIDQPNFDDDDDNNSQSPQRTINDLISTSTTAAGPSVQLVERMSATIRALESSKSNFQDELVRLSTQRDEARDEVVALMREVKGTSREKASVGVLEKESGEMKRRYEALLEMLGEKEEEVEGLRGDVGELKRMYRELVEEKMPVR